MGFETAPRQCVIHSKPQLLLQTTCIFSTSETLVAYTRVCLRTHALAHIRRLYSPRTWADGLFGHLFSKIDFYSFKNYIFHFNTP